MEEKAVNVVEEGVVASPAIFEDMCPFDFEQMEIITIEHGVKVGQCTNPECGYIRPV